MKKLLYIFCVALIAGAIFYSCDKDDETTVVDEFTGIMEEGDTDEFYVSVDGEDVLYIQREYVNFGSEEESILFPVTKDRQTLKEGFEDIMATVSQEELEAFATRWAAFKELSTEDKVTLFNYIKTYVIAYKFDLAQFATIQDNATFEALDYLTMQDLSLDFNYLMYLVKSGELTTYDEIIAYAYEVNGKTYSSSTANVDYSNTPTRAGVAGGVFSIIGGIFNLAGIVTGSMEIANSTGIIDVSTTSISVLNDSDTDVDNYSAGTLSRSSTYSVRYKPVFTTYGEFEFTIDAYYDSKYQGSYTGLENDKFIKDLRVNISKANASSTGTLNASVSYGSPINCGTSSAGIAKVLGGVSVEVGDCCCCRKYLNVNFEARGDTGVKVY